MRALKEATLSDPAALNSGLVRPLEDTGSLVDSDAATSMIRGASALLRPEREPGPTNGTRLRGCLAPWQEYRVIKHIDGAFGSNIQIKDLAAMSRLSPSYFARAFRRSFGVPPYVWILRLRLERAREIMLTTDRPLCEIALFCGFSDQSHMTRLFHRLVGQSPGAWRRGLGGSAKDSRD